MRLYAGIYVAEYSAFSYKYFIILYALVLQSIRLVMGMQGKTPCHTKSYLKSNNKSILTSISEFTLLIVLMPYRMGDITTALISTTYIRALSSAISF